MKKLFTILFLCFCFGASAQTFICSQPKGRPIDSIPTKFYLCQNGATVNVTWDSVLAAINRHVSGGGGSDSGTAVLPPLTASRATGKVTIGMVNQGTNTTVLHGNASGNPTFGAVVNADITSMAWSKLTGTPTTLSGYGITDAVPSSRTITINGTSHDLSTDRSYTIPVPDTTSLSNRINLKVDTVYLNAGSDSIIYKIHGRRHALALPSGGGSACYTPPHGEILYGNSTGTCDTSNDDFFFQDTTYSFIASNDIDGGVRIDIEGKVGHDNINLQTPSNELTLDEPTTSISIATQNFNLPAFAGAGVDKSLIIHSSGRVDTATISSGGSGWSLTGNSGTNPSTNFIGTTDNVGFNIITNNTVAAHFDSSQVMNMTTVQNGAFPNLIRLSNNYASYGGVGINIVAQQQDSLNISCNQSGGNITSSGSMNITAVSDMVISGSSGSNSLYINTAGNYVSCSSDSFVYIPIGAGHSLSTKYDHVANHFNIESATGDSVKIDKLILPNVPISDGWKDTTITLTPTQINTANSSPVVLITSATGMAIVVDLSKSYLSANTSDGSTYDITDYFLFHDAGLIGINQGDFVQHNNNSIGYFTQILQTAPFPSAAFSAADLTTSEDEAIYFSTDSDSSPGDGTFNIKVHLTFKRETNF